MVSSLWLVSFPPSKWWGVEGHENGKIVMFCALVNDNHEVFNDIHLPMNVIKLWKYGPHQTTLPSMWTTQEALPGHCLQGIFQYIAQYMASPFSVHVHFMRNSSSERPVQLFDEWQ